MLTTLLLLLPLSSPAPARTVYDNAGKLADTYVREVEKINRDHANSPGKKTEADLAKSLPKKAKKAIADLLKLETPGTPDALTEAAEAALDLDRMEDFERIRERLFELSPERAAGVGTAVSKKRFIVRGMNGLETSYLEHFAQVFETVLEGYDEVFGFREFSKVPGKKLRVLVHLEEKITKPPHFAPEFPYHSLIDFPVIDAERFQSPTADGKFLFYGLCHELGHVVAMWGTGPRTQEDHHAWAHYTGVVLVEYLQNEKDLEVLEGVNDVRWRSIARERETLKSVEPSLKDRDGVMALLLRLHDVLGPKAVGEAINHLDEENRRLRINHVRYYTFRDLERGLTEVFKKDKRKRKLVAEIMP